MRAPYQVLILLYREQLETEYLLLKRSDHLYWQFISGGGEDEEKPLTAARRETQEESGIDNLDMIALKSKTTMPVEHVCGFLWENEIIVMPEHSFAAKIAKDQIVKLSHEHLEYKWVNYETALKELHWDSNKTALWELNYRIKNDLWL